MEAGDNKCEKTGKYEEGKNHQEIIQYNFPRPKDYEFPAQKAH